MTPNHGVMDQSFLHRIGALMRKEFGQIRRDRRLALSLIIPPTLQMLLFGFALDASVSNLRLGILDDSRTPESRELIAAMSESKSFRAAGYFLSVNDLGKAIGRNDLDAGLVIPYDFARDMQRGRTTTVQVLLNAVNANTASIAQAYAQGVIATYNQTAGRRNIQMQMKNVPLASRGPIVTRTAFLYNPGLVTAWFIVTGTFGLLLILNSSIISSNALIKEREAGTVEQLLMTPAGTTEIVLAKITPLFLLLMMMVVLAITMMKLVFAVPTRGSLLLVVVGSACCVLSGIGIGTFIATFTKSAQQAMLMAFFVNPPLATLSGAFTPVEAMPGWLQPVTWLNPIRHFGIITRGVLIKGSGLGVLWPNYLALIAFTVVLVSLSVSRFRKQLG